MNTFAGMKAVTATNNKFEAKIKTTIVNLDKKELNELTELQKKLARRRQLNGESGGGSNNHIKSGAVTSKTLNDDDPDFTSPRSDAALSMMDIGRQSCPEFPRPSALQIESSTLPPGSTSPTQHSIPALVIPPFIRATSATDSTSVQEGDEIPPDSSHKSDVLNIILSDRSHILSDRSSISDISSATNRSQSQSYDWSSGAFAPVNKAMAISTLDDDSSSYNYNNSKNNNSHNDTDVNEHDKSTQLIHHHSHSSATPALSPIKEDSSVIAGSGVGMASGASSPVSASTAAAAVTVSKVVSSSVAIDDKKDSYSINLKGKSASTPVTSADSTATSAPVLLIDTTVAPQNAPGNSMTNDSVTAKSDIDSTETKSPSKFSPIHLPEEVILDSLIPAPLASTNKKVDDVASSELDVITDAKNLSTSTSNISEAMDTSLSSSSSSSSVLAEGNDSSKSSLHNSSTPPLPAYVAATASLIMATSEIAPLTSSANSNHTNSKRPTSTSSTAFVYNKEDEEKEIHLKMMQEKLAMQSLTDTDAVKAENINLIEKTAELEKKLKYSTHKISYLEKEIEELRATIVSRGGGAGGTGNRSRAGSAASRTSTGTRVGGSSGINASGSIPSAGSLVSANVEPHTASALLSSPSRTRSPAEHMKLRSERNLLELRNEQRERSSTLQTTSHTHHHTHSSDSSATNVSAAAAHTSTKRNTHTPMMDKYLTIGSSSFGFGAAFKAAMSSDDSSHVSSASHPTAATATAGSAPTTARTELGLAVGSGSAINDSKGDNPMRISPTNQPRNVNHSAEHTASGLGSVHSNTTNKNSTISDSSSSNGPFASLTSASLSLLVGSSGGSGMTSPVPLPGVRVPNAVVSQNKAKRTQPQGLESQLVTLEESLRLKGAGNIDPWYNQPKGYLKKPANFKRPDQDRLSTVTGSYGGSAGGGMRDSGKKPSMSILSHITQIFHFYHSRWFVLDYTTNLLSFYKDNKPGRVEKGNIHMENIIDIYTSQVADAPKYALDLISFDTRYTIVADSQESLVKWAFVLNMARKKNFRKGILRFNSISGGSGTSGKALTSSGNNTNNQPYNMNDLPSINNLAHVFESQGDYEQAEVYYKQYLEETRKLYGDDHVDTINAMSNLASLYQNQSKYDHAKIWNLNCIDTCRRAFGTNHVETLQAINKLAYLYEIQGQFENAEPLYVECSEIRKHVFNELVSDRESVYSDSGN